jgi:hypothetical protein
VGPLGRESPTQARWERTGDSETSTYEASRFNDILHMQKVSIGDLVSAAAGGLYLL